MNNKILQKANQVLKQKEYIQTCFKAGICPDCGTSLTIIDDDDDPFEWLYCTGCLPVQEIKHSFLGIFKWVSKTRGKFVGIR
jgi:hypothetical protein